MNEGRAISECRIGLAVLQPIGYHKDALPPKLFEYRSLGIPTVVSDYPLHRELVEGGGYSRVVDPTDPQAIGTAIAELAADTVLARTMGERGRAAVASRFNWEAEEKSLLSVYDRLLDGGKLP